MVTTSSVAGIVAGRNPLEYSSSSPYTLFLFQAILIILLCQLLHFPIKRLQQPKVIAEVIAGILLGPSVMGHIPNFTKTCFPKESIPGLSLLANIGIILFLFIIGLEVDLTFIKKHFRVAISVGLINMAIPFALGCGIAKGLYDEYKQDSAEKQIEFTTFMVFIAVAMCITAFPVLARILTELNLIGDRVGTIVLAAGIINDLTGWILLALVVTLANAADGVKVVYILLLTVAWFLFLCFPVRLVMRYLLTHFTNELNTGYPSQISMLLIIVTVFASAFFTDIIGVHAIFGAFMVGVIVPRDNGYVIKITEKLEDIVHIILIPIYFALAGLNVNLGLLNQGIDWAYIIGIISLAMVGKIFGGFVASKLNKLLWRESLTVGILMSCKGIVEIVVLNVGLSAGIISQRVYSMFIVMALVTTFATTPLAIWSYPVSYQEWRDKYLRGEVDKQGMPIIKEHSEDNSEKLIPNSINNLTIDNLPSYRITKIVLLLKNIDTISYLMTFIKSYIASSAETDIKAIHLREFSSRTYHLLEASTTLINDDEKFVNESNQNEFYNSSSILHIVRAFSDLLNIDCSLKSILSTLQNHVNSINDQILDSSNLLLTSASLNKFNCETNEYSLCMKLFRQSKCNFGLLLLNDLKIKSNYRKFSSDESSKSTDSSVEVVSYNDDEVMGGLIEFKGLNLLFNNDNIISSSDLLALHTTYKLIGKNTLRINVFIKSGHNFSFTDARINEITKLFKEKNSNLDISFILVKNSIHEEIRKKDPSIVNELFVVANNLSPVASASSMFDEDISHLLDSIIAQSFHVLIVKAPNA